MKTRPTSAILQGLVLLAGLAGASCSGGGSGGLGVVPQPPPDILVTKTALPTSVPETGGNVNFSIAVVNSTADSWTIDSLTDTDFNLAAPTRCPTIVGSVVAAGQTKTCNFTEALSGSAAGPPHQNTVTAQVSNGSTIVTDTASATVTFTDVLLATFTSDVPAATLRMTPVGTPSGPDFDVNVAVTNIANFYAAAFHVTYDPTKVNFLGSDSSGSFLQGAGATLFFASLVSGIEGEVAVEAGLQGNVAGVPSGSGVLITLKFRAIAAATDSRLDFNPAGLRRITVCPTAGPGCSDTTRTWSGGSVDAN